MYITNFSNHKRPAEYRTALWIYAWLELFENIVTIVSFNWIAIDISRRFLCWYYFEYSQTDSPDAKE